MTFIRKILFFGFIIMVVIFGFYGIGEANVTLSRWFSINQEEYNIENQESVFSNYVGTYGQNGSNPWKPPGKPNDPPGKPPGKPH